MSRWVLFISRRHFRTRRRHKGHTAGILSVVGIAAGTLTLISVISVMNGFQSGTINDILEINSYHLQVESVGSAEMASQIGDVPGVASAIRFVDVFGLASGYFLDPVALVVRGIPRDALLNDSSMGDALNLLTGSLALHAEGTVVIGEELARRLGVRLGDSIDMVNFGAADQNLLSPESGSLQVTGIFKSGFLEFDAGWGFVSLETAQGRLSSGDTPTVGVKLTDRFADRRIGQSVAALPRVSEVTSWREYNRAIFGALRLEKSLMMFLVGLIFVVVGVNIYQSLRRSVVERTEEISVLRTVGATPRAIRTIFVMEGALIGVVGGTVGTFLGLLIALNINGVFVMAEAVVNGVLMMAEWVVAAVVPGRGAGTGGFSIFSPAYFYLDEVPAVVIPAEVIAVFVFAVASATLAGLVASRQVSRIKPVTVLRYE